MTIYRDQALFQDRTEAGRRLAVELAGYEGKESVVFAIPRGVASYYRRWYDLDDDEINQYLESWRTKSAV
jgi:predicted phosphoribosyltransferase